MKPTDRVDIVVGTNSGRLKFAIAYSKYLDLAASVEAGDDCWRLIKLDSIAEVRINPKYVVFLRLLSIARVSADERTGVTLFNLAEVLGERYHTLRQRLKRDKVPIEKTSDRRILINEFNIRLLELTPKQVSDLRKFEEGP